MTNLFIVWKYLSVDCEATWQFRLQRKYKQCIFWEETRYNIVSNFEYVFEEVWNQSAISVFLSSVNWFLKENKWLVYPKVLSLPLKSSITKVYLQRDIYWFSLQYNLSYLSISFSSPTRDQIYIPCSGSTDPLPLYHQRIQLVYFSLYFSSRNFLELYLFFLIHWLPFYQNTNYAYVLLLCLFSYLALYYQNFSTIF